MNHRMYATFSSTDQAEYVAAYLQQHIPHIAQVAIRPRHPDSLQWQNTQPVQFSVYTTAALSPHNITGVIEHPITEADLPEPERDQSAVLQLLYRTSAQQAVQNIVIALGGTQIKTWDA